MVDFIIIGAQKGGTTSAAHNLNLHPMIRVFNGITEYGQREIEFFNQHWDRGGSWYRGHFPLTAYVQGEKTAELFHRLVCHTRIYETVPKAKMIVVLRCPVRRAFSQWKMARFSKRDETRSFETIIESEMRALMRPEYREGFYSLAESQMSCWREGYLLKGFYCEQLLHLYSVFSRANVYVGISERIRENKVSEYGKMFEFLGVPAFNGPFGEHFVGAAQSELSRRSREILSELYRPHNRLLFSLIGYDIPEWL